MLFRGKIRCSIKYRVLTDTSPLVNNKSSTRGAWSLLKQVQSHIGLNITMDPSDESAGSLEDLE